MFFIWKGGKINVDTFIFEDKNEKTKYVTVEAKSLTLLYLGIRVSVSIVVTFKW